MALELEDSLHWIQAPALETLIEEVEVIQSTLKSNPGILENYENELIALIDPESFSVHNAVSNILSEDIITIHRLSVDDDLNGYSWYLSDSKIINQRLNEIVQLHRWLKERPE